MPAVEEVVVEAVEEAKVERIVTNVEKSGIWLVHALILLVMLEDTAHSVVAMVRRRLGRYFLSLQTRFWLIIC
jgi:hypothetical protein